MRPDEFFNKQMFDIQQNWLENELKVKSRLANKEHPEIAQKLPPAVQK